MVKTPFPQGPNFVHPEKPSAVGSRNSLHRSGRSEYVESQAIIDEEVDKILNHIDSKLPPEVLSKLHVGTTVKEILHNYFNQSFNNMFNRYLTTVEDEMAKKFRLLLDKEESKTLNRYAPKEMASLLTSIADEAHFDTSEVEKSTVNIFGHLHGHVQRGVFEVEQSTNSLLRQKADVGAFIRGENIYAVVKCSFSNCDLKPQAVQKIQLSLNILNEELISELFHYQLTSDYLLREVVATYIQSLVDRELKKLNDSLVDDGKSELDESERMFEKLKISEQFTKDVTETTKQQAVFSEQFLESMKGMSAEIARMDNPEFDPLNLSSGVQDLLERENIRDRGFSTAINALTRILDTSKMGYQYIQNYKNQRLLIVREYEDKNVYNLPDERYDIALAYFDYDQLVQKRLVYRQQMLEFQNEVERLYLVTQKIYAEYYKTQQGNIDFDDIAEEYLLSNKKSKFNWFFFFSSKNSEDEDDEEDEKIWDEFSFVEPIPTQVESEYNQFHGFFNTLFHKLNHVKEKFNKSFKLDYPEDRLILEGRLEFLHDSIKKFSRQYNPYHCQTGLVLDINISTVIRKQTTMKAMSDVLNEFLFGVSRGFSDTAFAKFKRRRSTDTAEELGDFESYRDVAPDADEVVKI